jgi:hypothetical protein
MQAPLAHQVQRPEQRHELLAWHHQAQRGLASHLRRRPRTLVHLRRHQAQRGLAAHRDAGGTLAAVRHQRQLAEEAACLVTLHHPHALHARLRGARLEHLSSAPRPASALRAPPQRLFDR